MWSGGFGRRFGGNDHAGETMKLRDYEFDALKRYYVAGQRRTLIVGPTGSGKTVVAARMMRKLLDAGRRVLFVAHRRELILQAKQRLVEQGVAKLDIGIILSGCDESPASQIQIASMDTLRKRDKPAAELVIIDEAHHAKAKTYLELIEHYSDSEIVGLTATPYRLDGSPLGDIFDEIVELPKPTRLIADGWLSKPRIWTVPESQWPVLNRIKKVRGDFELNELGRLMSDRTLVGSLVAHWNKHADGIPTVAYAVNVQHAQAITDTFTAAGISAALLTGETGSKERNGLLEGLKIGKIKVLCNVMVLAEGWDWPDAKCCIMARPTMSTLLWIQICGRFMRPSSRVPVILDHVGNAIYHPLPHWDQYFNLYEEDAPKIRCGVARVKTCPVCELTVASGQRICPNCDFEFWSSDLISESDGSLVEVTPKRACKECGGRLAHAFGYCLLCTAKRFAA